MCVFLCCSQNQQSVSLLSVLPVLGGDFLVRQRRYIYINVKMICMNKYRENMSRCRYFMHRSRVNMYISTYGQTPQSCKVYLNNSTVKPSASPVIILQKKFTNAYSPKGTVSLSPHQICLEIAWLSSQVRTCGSDFERISNSPFIFLK